MAGAGMITPGTSPRLVPAALPLAFGATTHYPQLIAELAEADAGDTGYATVGAIYVARDESEAPSLDAVQRLLIERRDSGMSLIGEVERISGDRARALFPPLTPDAPGGGLVRRWDAGQRPVAAGGDPDGRAPDRLPGADRPDVDYPKRKPVDRNNAQRSDD